MALSKKGQELVDQLESGGKRVKALLDKNRVRLVLGRLTVQKFDRMEDGDAAEQISLRIAYYTGIVDFLVVSGKDHHSRIAYYHDVIDAWDSYRISRNLPFYRMTP